MITMHSRWWPATRAPLTACLAALLVNNVFAKPTPAEKVEAWDPNYCNDTKMQETAGLTKTALGQFLGYQCDSVFFHCRWGVDGWRTYKKRCRKGLVYDTTGTQNCNYDFNVDGCGMKQCADCLGEQYACCLSEECVDSGMRCDGKYDCTLEEDEQNCPTCGAGQFPCVLSEQCIDFDKRCNGVKECKDGTDEQHCDECQAGNFFCRNSKKCIELKHRCDGKRDCNLGEDEAFCVSGAEEQKEYTCEDQVHTVPKQDVCNGVDDCPDGSDELYCISTNPDEESPSASRGLSPFNTAKVGSLVKTNSTKINSNASITGAAPPVDEGEPETDDETELEEEIEDQTKPTDPSIISAAPPPVLSVSTRRVPPSTLPPPPPSTPASTLASSSTTRAMLVTRHGLGPVSSIIAAGGTQTTRRPKAPSVTPSTTPIANEEEYFYEEKSGT